MCKEFWSKHIYKFSLHANTFSEAREFYYTEYSRIFYNLCASLNVHVNTSLRINNESIKGEFNNIFENMLKEADLDGEFFFEFDYSNVDLAGVIHNATSAVSIYVYKCGSDDPFHEVLLRFDHQLKEVNVL